ncbi:MAG: methyltransferase domain-containing protein, partial [Verrucomicrobiota bacterium]
DRAGIVEGTNLIDRYCGTGSISLLAARRGARVFGLEWAESAVEDAERNAELNEIEGCRFQALDLNKMHRSVDDLKAFGKPDVIITDPPRAGMHPKAVLATKMLEPDRIVYVSCKPASLARDAAMFCEDGSWTLKEVQPIDLFPQTQHIENVAVMERAD